MIRRRKTLVATAFLTVLAAATIGATPAAAHDELVSSTPSSGDVLTSLPASIALTFEEPPAEGYTTVKVFGPSGADIASGSAVSEGSVVTQALRAPSAAGRYTVDWSVLSDDGHPVSGSFAFIVRTSATSTPASAMASPDVKTGGGNGLVWLVVAVAGLVVLVCGAALTRRYRSGSA